jgi:hypothetical protein
MSASLSACVRSGVASLLLICLASAGHARSDARTLTCSQVQALLDSQGSAVLSTGPNSFDRYVSLGASCMVLELWQPVFIATKDSGQCRVYRCQRRRAPSR